MAMKNPYIDTYEDGDMLSDYTLGRETDERIEDFASAVVDTLTYNFYRWQRKFYGIAADRLKPHFPQADAFEAMYQDEIRRAA